MKKAFITGIAGQDGSYLARLLLQKGYQVAGASRHGDMAAGNLDRLHIAHRVQWMALDVTDSAATRRVLEEVSPHEIYHLAGQSSVGRSFQDPGATFDSIALGTRNILEVVRESLPRAKVFSAGSCECFGEAPVPAREDTPFRPSSPYAAAKAAAFWLASTYRMAYKLFLCTGILFNHESPLRPEGFVTRKIIDTARRIAAGSQEKLALGNTGIVRDWGWAPEYVEAMWRMLQQDKPQDFVLATGESRSLTDFVASAFSHVGLDWKDHVTTDPHLMRPTDIMVSRGDPSRAREVLGWEARYRMEDVARMLIQDLSP